MSWFNIKIPGVTFCLNDVEGERTLDNCTVMVNQQNVLVWYGVQHIYKVEGMMYISLQCTLHRGTFFTRFFIRRYLK